MRFRALTLGLIVFLCGDVLSDEIAAPSRENLDFFEREVRPVLSQKCVRCHGSGKQQGGLRLDSREAILTGGESGPAVQLGDSDASLIVQAIRRESIEMPPDGRLPQNEIDAITRWVNLGAPWPQEIELLRASVVFTDEDRNHWSFQPLKRVSPPDVDDQGWSKNGIDRFIWSKLNATGIKPSPTADPAALLRRVYFDLIGLPPSAEETDKFIADHSEEAFQRVVDSLLESPRYGEKWARHWLDLVRYAESDGYKQDTYRPNAWRYRDYVIQSFNSDKPYDRFVREQLAGDELFPGDLEALAGTGYLRLWIYEYNQRDVRGQRQTILNDLTDVTSDVFLGVGLGCARCHDHKYDPLPQRDYYRLQAFFTPLLPRDDIPIADRESVESYRQRLSVWEERTADLRRQIDEMERPIFERVAEAAINKFPPDVRPMMLTSAIIRGPLEKQISDLAFRQVQGERDGLKMASKLPEEQRPQWEELRKQLDEFKELRPEPLPMALTATDVGPEAPPTVIPGDSTGESVEPGFLSILGEDTVRVEKALDGASTGRRSALALWLTRPDNPLSTRVIVNRVWQYHFGRGIVGTCSDLGRLGDRPTHPELLDWLTNEFIDGGWRLKSLHRAIVSSSTYRQSSSSDASARESDPANRLLSRATIRRLESEQVRDAMLAVSGELDVNSIGGESVAGESPRRSVYVKVLRNQPDMLLRTLDGPDGYISTAKRESTTIPTQALLMINGQWSSARASAFAKKVMKSATEATPEVWASLAIRSAFGRNPTERELNAASKFLREGIIEFTSFNSDEPPTKLVDLCHVLLNSNEFFYLD